jgi:predicted nucleic acid-binding Zn ribbon protein
MKNCPFCGKEFEPTYWNNLFCSVKCRPTFHKKKKPKKHTCIECRSIFLSTQPKARFCSEICRKKNWRIKNANHETILQE